MKEITNSEIVGIINTVCEDEEKRRMLIDRIINGMSFADIYVKYNLFEQMSERTYNKYLQDMHVYLAKVNEAVILQEDGMSNPIINEFKQYCDSLDEDCPVVCLNALYILNRWEEELRIMFNRCITYVGFDGCVHCRFREDCESMRSMRKLYVIENGKRVRRDEANDGH